MKIFISSLINGFEPFRAAACAAVQALDHVPVMAEQKGGAGLSLDEKACLMLKLPLVQQGEQNANPNTGTCAWLARPSAQCTWTVRAGC